MKINFTYRNKFSFLKERKIQIKNVIESLLRSEKIILGNLNLIFCSDEFIRAYNKEFLDHDFETDIITFHDENEEGQTEGELLISTDTVKSNSKKFKTDFDNELNRVIIHGVLHLCGYKDKTKREKIEMRKKENFYLKNIL